MGKMVSLECDNCGAKVPSKTSYGTFDCQYCGHRFRVEAPRPAPVVMPNVVHVSVGDVQSKVKKTLLVVAVVTILIGVGTAFFISRIVSKVSSEITSRIPSRSSSSSTSYKSSSKRSKSSSSSAATKSERLNWDNVGGEPQWHRGAKKEHVVGRIREMQSQQLSVRMYDSGTLKETFRTPNLGKYSDVYRTAHFTLAGDRLLVIDESNTLRVFDPFEGKELVAHPLTDSAKQLCAFDGSMVWVEVIDGQSLIYDAAGLSAKPAAERPSACPENPSMARRRPARPTKRALPRLQGIKATRLFVEGDTAVAFGHTSPGTPKPMAVGFSPVTKKVLWTEPVVQADATTYRKTFMMSFGGLAKGRFVAAYGVGQHDWRVAARDAETGAPVWDVALEQTRGSNHIQALQFSGDYVYIVRRTQLVVLSGSDGAVLGTVGR